ncbi:MAG: glycosyl transferase family 2 [Nitrospiraceae bacterium]|nr:MAG: glycosyl transferase family 2 [Nitrospiraceae bacterium]
MSSRDIPYNFTAINEEALEKLKETGHADIIIGIPSYNNAKSIGRVIKAAELGLAKYFPSLKGLIIISEGGNIEETQRAVNALTDKHYFENAFIPRPENETGILVAKYLGPSGKGTAVKAILEAGKFLGFRAGCMLDADLRSISPEWIEMLIAPVALKNFGFVTPYYSRHKYDGTITNMIAYPMTCALYGRRVRQPIGGDFGFSPELAESLLAKDVWESDIARFGIDIWMTTTAICENFRICQSFLGAKLHDDKDPGKDLSPMFRQVVGTIFSLMESYEGKWLQVKGSRPTAIFGFESEAAPKPIEVDPENLINKFKDSLPLCMTVLKEVLSPENLQKVEEIAGMDHALFELPEEIWIKSLFDFAIAYTKSPGGLGPDDVIEALVPLYYAKVASFVRKTINLDSHQAEEIINQQRYIFEKLKPYLAERWGLDHKRGVTG